MLKLIRQLRHSQWGLLGQCPQTHHEARADFLNPVGMEEPEPLGLEKVSPKGPLTGVPYESEADSEDTLEEDEEAEPVGLE